MPMPMPMTRCRCQDFQMAIINLLKMRVCCFLYDVINEKICPPLNDFYELKVKKNTINNANSISTDKRRFFGWPH